MHCPKCTSKKKTKVIDSRLKDEIIRRRRQCQKCGHRFTTWESISKVDSREALAKIMKKRIDKIKKQAQAIITGIEERGTK